MKRIIAIALFAASSLAAVGNLSAQDHMVNPKPALDFAPLIHAKTIVLQSDCGHMAPGCEAATLFPAVPAFLAGK